MQSERAKPQEVSGDRCTCSGSKSELLVIDALRVQLNIQRRLHEQLEIQRNLQLRIEAQGKKLQMIYEEQLRASRIGTEQLDELGVGVAFAGVSEQEETTVTLEDPPPT